MKKPKWCPDTEWKHLRVKYERNGHMNCATPDCGASTADPNIVMTLDHIVPRYKGGKDESSNLQPMCLSCNSRKNKNPDKQWSKANYFDSHINTGSLRVSQNDFVYEPIMQNKEFFAQPWSSINGKLFSYVQIVGAGKTLGMFSLPFALNQVAGGPQIGAPRVQRMLIVTKDRPLRSQIVQELRDEPEKYGIVHTAPTVLEVEAKSDLTSIGGPDHDIAVMCPNLLWPRIDHEHADLPQKYDDEVLERVIERYQIIIFDEMHYAHANIRNFVKIAASALVFGFTASPMDANGALLAEMVLMGQAYGYREAIIHDQSMKGVIQRPSGEGEPGDSRFINVQVLKASEQVVDGATRNDTQLEGLPAVKSVCDRVCLELKACDDNIQRQDRVMSNHRVTRGSGSTTPIVVGSHYVAHAIIRVDDRLTAKDVVDYLNQKFSADRGIFPKRAGWTAAVVDGMSADAFDKSHPFFRYKEQGKIDSQCVRIVVVVDRAVEGMNNKYLLIEGVATARHKGSTAKQVQMRGRLLRSTAFYDKAGNLVVPPSYFDQIQIITHEAFANRDEIDASLDFIINMNASMTGVMMIEEYVDSDVDLSSDEDDNYTPSIDWETLVKIALAVGQALSEGRKIRVKALADKLLNTGTNRTKRMYVEAAIQSAISGGPMPYYYKRDGNVVDGLVTFRDLFENRLYNDLPDPLQIVFSEKVARRAMDEKACEEFLRSQGALAGLSDAMKVALGSDFVKVVNGFEISIENKHTGAEINIAETPAQRVDAYIAEMVDLLCGNNAATDSRAGVIRDLYHEAVAHSLSAQPLFTSLDDLKDGGTLCDPAVTHSLRNVQFRDKVRGWVVMQLLEQKMLAEVELLGVMQ
jgi:hypothetical protein